MLKVYSVGWKVSGGTEVQQGNGKKERRGETEAKRKRHRLGTKRRERERLETGRGRVNGEERRGRETVGNGG